MSDNLNPSTRAMRPKPPFSEEERKQARYMRCELGLSFGEIANRMGERLKKFAEP